MREIYSLGRVAGFSAYELYVRQNEYEDPGSIPASEREWLASTIAMGSSMLCRIEADMSHDPEDDWVLEVPFPENTRLLLHFRNDYGDFRANGRPGAVGVYGKFTTDRRAESIGWRDRQYRQNCVFRRFEP